MVKHNHNKKRRSTSRGRTKIKNRNNFKRWDPSPKISDPVVREHWDPSKSPSQNLASMGLLARPNADIKNVNGGKSPSAPGPANLDVSIVELFDVPDSDELRERKRGQRCPLTGDDQQYIAKCLAKHGDDYGKAFRDVKVNCMQHTEMQLRKMGARFLLLSPEQRTVDVPERVLSLMP